MLALIEEPNPWALMASLGAQSRPVLAGALIIALVYGISRPAHAEVSVEGRIDAVRLDVRDASVHEALAALSATFGLRVYTSTALDWPVSGSYQGSLQQVVARLLAGRDFVATHSAGNMEIRILGPGGGGISQQVAGCPATPIVPNVAPIAAAPAPVPNMIVDKGRLMFGPR